MHFGKFLVSLFLFIFTICSLSAHDSSMDLFMNHGSVMLIIDPDLGRIAFANRQASLFYKLPLKVLLNQNIKDINQLSPLDVEHEMLEAKRTEKNYFLFKHRTGANEIKDVEVYSYPIEFEEKKMLFSIIVDVTDQLKSKVELKSYELKAQQNLHITIYLILAFLLVVSIMVAVIYAKNKKLLYLTNYDPLTGVLNRRSIISIYNCLQKKRRFPIAVFMIDVNNLKFINDTFGHIAGDKMIIEVSNMLKSLTKVKSIISRVSGDEFVLIIPNATEDVVNEYVKFINSRHIAIEGIEFNSSVGVYMVNSIILPYEFAFTKAEEKMYTQKSLTKASINVNIQNSLMSRAAKAVGLENDLQHISKISGLIAERIGLNSHDVKNIKEAANLQVIGYATLSENDFQIVDEESMCYQKHSEKGYNILTTLGKNNSVATAVFYHHENYDGTGFPKSIKGEDIPLASRVITLANGVYRMMKSNELESYNHDVFDCILKGSGTIYDPELVELIDSQEFSFNLN